MDNPKVLGGGYAVGLPRRKDKVVDRRAPPPPWTHPHPVSRKQSKYSE